MTTRPEVRAEVVREFGGYSGSLPRSPEGAITSVTLPQAWRAHGQRWKGSMLMFPDAESEANRIREVTGMSRGTASFEGRAAIADGERYELYPPDLSAPEVDDAIHTTLGNTLHPVTTYIPTIAGPHVYEMPDWMDDWRNIRAVDIRDSPCLLDNEDFDSWVLGPDAAPTGWVASDDLVVRRRDGAQLSGNGEHLAQTIRLVKGQATRNLTVLVETDDQSAVRLVVGSIGSSPTTYRNTLLTTGGGEPTTTTIADAETHVSLQIRPDSAAAVTVTRVLAVWADELPEQLREHGSLSWRREEVRWQRVVGRTHPAIELSGEQLAGRQLVVAAVAPFGPVADDTSISDANVRLLMHGAIFHLSNREVEGEDASVRDRRRAIHGPAYAQLAARLRQDPVPDPIRPVYVGGA